MKPSNNSIGGYLRLASIQFHRHRRLRGLFFPLRPWQKFCEPLTSTKIFECVLSDRPPSIEILEQFDLDFSKGVDCQSLYGGLFGREFILFYFFTFSVIKYMMSYVRQYRSDQNSLRSIPNPGLNLF
jgi:hypothetical protein